AHKPDNGLGRSVIRTTARARLGLPFRTIAPTVLCIVALRLDGRTVVRALMDREHLAVLLWPSTGCPKWITNSRCPKWTTNMSRGHFAREATTHNGWPLCVVLRLPIPRRIAFCWGQATR